MSLIAIHRAIIGMFDATKGPRNYSKLESKPIVGRNTSRSVNFRGLLSMCLLILLVSAEPYSWSNNLDNNERNYNLKIDLTICPTMCNVCP